VLLMFAGLFGFVTFSFAQLRSGLRPLAEAAIPLVVFGAAHLLGRRGSQVAARALVVTGGLLLPTVVLASFVDGIPPEPTGRPLAAAMAAACLVIAAGYAALTRRRPGTALRYLVAPAGWLAVAMAALAFRHPVPTGQHIATPTPPQLAAVLTAIALTLAVLRLRPALDPRGATAMAAVPALATTALATVLALAAAGWPPVPLAIAGTAALLSLDLLTPRLRVGAVTLAETAVIAGTALGLAPHLGTGWAGAVATVAALVVTERAGRSPGGPAAVPLGLAVVLLFVAAAEPWALVVAASVATAWAHARRVRPPTWLPAAGALSVVAALLPAGVGVGLVGALGATRAVPILAAATLLAASVVAAIVATTADRGRDPFWRWWLPAAATAVLFAAAGLPATPLTVAAVGALTAAYALVPGGVAARVWTTGPALLLTVAVATQAWHLPAEAWPLAAAGAGLLAVLAAIGRPASRPAAHAGALGHLVALVAWSVANHAAHAGHAAQAGHLAGTHPGAVTPVLAAAVLGFALTAIAQEAGRAAIPDLAAAAAERRPANTRPDTTRPADTQPADGWPAEGRPSGDNPEGRTADGWRTEGRPSEDSPAGDRSVERLVRLVPAVLAAVLAPFLLSRALADAHVLVRGEPWWPVALSGLAVAYALTARALRPAYRRLARPLADAGSVLAVLAALACDWRWPALAALGAVAVLPPLLGPALRREPAGWLAWAATAPAAVLAVVPDVPGATWSRVLLAWSAAVLLGTLLADRVVGGAGTDGKSLIRLAGCRAPAVLSGAGLVAALTVAPLVESRTGLAWAWLAGAAVLAAAGWLLRVEALAGTGAGLALAAGAVAGPGWLALALGAVAAATTGAGWYVANPARRWLWLAGAVSAVAAWRTALVWLELPHDAAANVVAAWWLGLRHTGVARDAAVSALVAGALSVLVSAAARLGLDRDFARCWLGASVAAVLLTLGNPDWTIAAGLIAAALATGLGAAPLGLPFLRGGSAALLITAGLILQADLQLTYEQISWTSMGIATVLSAFVLIPVATVWHRSALAVATAAALTGLVFALPDRAMFVLALLVGAACTLAASVALRRPNLVLAVPAWLCAAWLTWAYAAVAGQLQWLTLPGGLTLLAMAGLRRGVLRRAGKPANPVDVVTLEATGMLLAVAPAYLQALTTSTAYGLLAAAIGVALTIWGAATRVVRRLAMGVTTTAGAILLVVIVPLIPLAPQWGSAGPWLVLAAVGLGTVVAATMLDTARRALRTTTARLTDLTAGWE
jgi:hypothetical protein